MVSPMVLIAMYTAGMAIRPMINPIQPRHRSRALAQPEQHTRHQTIHGRSDDGGGRVKVGPEAPGRHHLAEEREGHEQGADAADQDGENAEDNEPGAAVLVAGLDWRWGGSVHLHRNKRRAAEAKADSRRPGGVNVRPGRGTI